MNRNIHSGHFIYQSIPAEPTIFCRRGNRQKWGTAMERTIRTDLAIELREDIKDRGELDGIQIATKIHRQGIRTTTINVTNEKGAETLASLLELILRSNVRRSGNLMKRSMSRCAVNFQIILKNYWEMQVPFWSWVSETVR